MAFIEGVIQYPYRAAGLDCLTPDKLSPIVVQKRRDYGAVKAADSDGRKLSRGT
jgi:hypothetical protein